MELLYAYAFFLLFYYMLHSSFHGIDIFDTDGTEVTAGRLHSSFHGIVWSRL